MLTFDDLLESFGFKTLNLEDLNSKITSSIKYYKNRPFTPCLFWFFLFGFVYIFFLGDAPDLFDLMELTLKYQVAK